MKITVEKKLEFLQTLARTGSAVRAAKSVGISRSRLYELRQREPGFAEAWERQLQWSEQLFKLEERAVSAAKLGSSSMLKFMLKEYIPRIVLPENEGEDDDDTEYDGVEQDTGVHGA